MFCHECGAKGIGKFCVECGTRLLAAPEPPIAPAPGPPPAFQAASAPPPLPTQVPSSLFPPPPPAAAQPVAPAAGEEFRGDWHREVRYDLLIRHPEVREHLARAANHKVFRISAEQSIKVYDKFVAKAVGGVPIGDMAEILLPLCKSWGFQTGKNRTEVVAAPIGLATVSALYALAYLEAPLKGVHQASDGCAIEAKLPSDMFTWEGQVMLTIAGVPHGARVEAAAKVEGQMYDWGKCNRWLDSILQTMRTFAASIPHNRVPAPHHAPSLTPFGNW